MKRSMSFDKGGKKMNSHASTAIGLLAAFVLALILMAPVSSHAVPSMARQTGMQCAACHTVFPELTAFGRQFKLRGYAMSAPKTKAEIENNPFGSLPISFILQASRTETKNVNTAGAESDQFPRDRDVIAQAAGVYYGGKITDKSGGLVQYFYDGIERTWALEMFDVRWADVATPGGKELVYGFTLSNNPTVTDPYNSVPQWSFPHAETAALMPNAQAITDLRLAGRVGGPGVYALWNNLVYTELALYRTTKTGAFRPLGWGVEKEDIVKGTAPYARIALQREIGEHSFAVGAYGMSARLYADDEDLRLGADRFRNWALDGQYQFISGDHIASVQAIHIRERQSRGAGFAAGLASNPVDTLRTSRANVHYWFQRRIGGGVGVFSTTGSVDQALYNNGEPVHGSIAGSPETRGWMVDLNYLPVQNVKLSLRYTAYSKFNGARDNYDGFGRNAKDNNSVYLLAWLMF